MTLFKLVNAISKHLVVIRVPLVMTKVIIMYDSGLFIIMHIPPASSVDITIKQLKIAWTHMEILD